MWLEPNAGLTDRYWRITAGTLVLGCGIARMARGNGLTGAGLSLLGGMFLADGILGTCLMYQPMGVDTREHPWDDADEDVEFSDESL